MKFLKNKLIKIMIEDNFMRFLRVMLALNFDRF